MSDLGRQMRVASIRPPKHKLRDDLGDLTELKISMQNMQLHPVIVRHLSQDLYELITGHRRWMAAIELKWEYIEAKIVQVDNKTALEIAIQENFERKDMDPLEEAKAFKLYIKDHGYGSTGDLAKKLGVSNALISDRMSLLNLPEEVFPHGKSSNLSTSHLETISRLETKEAVELSNIIEKVSLTTDQTQKATKFIQTGHSAEEAVRTVLEFPDMTPLQAQKYNPVKMAREEIVSTLLRALKSVDFSLDKLPEGPEKGVWTGRIRYKLHELVNDANRVKREVSKE